MIEYWQAFLAIVACYSVIGIWMMVDAAIHTLFGNEYLPD